MSQSSYGPLFEALAHYNDKLLDMAKAQTERTAQALLQTNLDDLGQVLEQGSQQPWQLINAQMNWWQDQLKLMQHTLLKSAGQQSEPLIAPERSDRRFKADAWSEQPIYDYLKQSYLLTAKHLLASVDALEGVPQKSRERLRFFTRQYINAMAPSNFLATNPELLKLTLESDGQNLVRGLALLAEDLERSADQLNIRLTDESAFELGRDLALTPGRVVQRTELYELIQYSPTTETVARTPVLIVPPFINKYYILDMRPQNSLVAWLVAQGQTVFMISWRNPGPAQADIDLDDYVVDGVIAALDGVEAATGEREVHGIGYCIGGTALSLAMGWLAGCQTPEAAGSIRHPVHHPARLLPAGGAWHLHPRAHHCGAGSPERSQGHHGRAPAGGLLQPAAGEQPLLELLHRQLPQGAEPGGVRSAALEQRQHQRGG